MLQSNAECGQQMSDAVETQTGMEGALQGEVNNNNAVDKAVPGEGRVLEVREAEEWLCVAKLPRDTTEQEFSDLLAEFGRVRTSLLMQSDTTGEFKKIL